MEVADGFFILLFIYSARDYIHIHVPCHVDSHSLTGAEVNTEKLCLKLCNVARGPKARG